MTNRVFDAPVADTGPIPAYKVMEHNEPVVRLLSHFDEKSRTIVQQEVINERGYMVYFPKGHSRYYESLEALEAAGMGEIVPLITMSGEAEMNTEHTDKLPTTRRKIG